MQVNAIMEKLDKSDGNGYQSKNNINNFSPLYESDDEEGTKNRNKTKTPVIVLSEEEKGRINKGGQNKGNEEDGNDQEKKTTVKVYDLDSDGELNRDFRTA